MDTDNALQIIFVGTKNGNINGFKYKDDKLFIDSTQYFTRIPKEICDYYIGGNQILRKWINNKKGTPITDNFVDSIIHIANTIAETIKLIDLIDAHFN